jgi:hypothetical protein
MNLIMIIATIFAAVSGEKPGHTDSTLSRCVRERMTVDSGELIIKAKFLVLKDIPQAQGSSRKFHIWFQSYPKMYRFDIEVENDRDYDKSFHSERFCYDGTIFKIVDDMNSHKPLRQYSYIPNPAPSVFDPRILGLHFGPILWMAPFHLDGLLKLIDESTLVESTRSNGGKREIYIADKERKLIYDFDDNGQPAAAEYLRGEGGSEEHYKLDITTQVYKNTLHFPKSIHLVEYKGSTVQTDEKIDIDVIQLNERLDSSVFSWKSLSPKPGSRLVFDHDYKTQSVYWNGERIQNIPKELLHNLSADLMRYEYRSWRRIIVAACLLVVSVFLLIAYRYRLKRSRLPRNNVE